jgi:N-acyl-D-amino-acid deacylase
MQAKPKLYPSFYFASNFFKVASGFYIKISMNSGLHHCICFVFIKNLNVKVATKGLGYFMYDIVIKNGRVIDGTGSPWFKADVGIKNGKIVKIGRINDESYKVIDADGLIVSPGWVDFHSHSDWNLVRYPLADSDLIQGATLVVTGNCGISAAPILGEVALRWAKNMAKKLHINLDWSTFDEYLTRLERQGVSMNVACLVGHSTIRMCVMGNKDRPAEEKELANMKDLIDEAMRSGAFGMSSGLVYWPGCWSNTHELIELCKVVANYDGIYVSHIRGERETQIEATNELLEIGEKASVRIHRSHMQSKYPVYGNGAKVLKLFEEARERGIDVACDTEAFPWIGYEASSVLPPWPFKNSPEFIDILKNPEMRAKLKKEMMEMDPYGPLGRTGDGGIYQKRAWDRVWVYECKSDPTLEGKKISEIAKERSVEPEDALFDLIVAENGEGPKVFVAHIEDDHNITAPNPLCIFPSTDGSVVETNKIPKQYFQYSPQWLGMFPRVIGCYVKEERLMSVEEAIRRMTSFACQRLRIFDRGIIREGMWADLTIFDYKTIRARGDYQNPQQKPEGIEYVLVNGQIAVEHGDFTGIQAGKVLRHQI